MQEFKMKINYAITSKKDSLNVIYAGKHWSNRKRYADFIKKMVNDTLDTSYKDVPLFSKPVCVEFRHNSKLDIDNYAFFEKCVVDAFKGRIIKNDSKKYFRVKISRFDEKLTENEVEVIVKEL